MNKHLIGIGSRLPVLALGLAWMCIASSASAHHSPAGYDTAKTITAQGTVSKIQWFNPHVYVYMEGISEDGKKIEWEIECFPPIALRGFGWSKGTVQVGDKLSVRGNPARNPIYRGIYPSVITLGDRTLFSMKDAAKLLIADARPQKSTEKANGLRGLWTPTRSMPLVMQFNFPDASKLTKEGQAALKRSDEKTGPVTDCIPSAAPIWMVAPTLKRMTIEEGVIRIEDEYEGARRIIHLNNATHEGAIPSFQGDSIGRWEGKTLVVDSTHFAYHGMGNGGGNGIAPNFPSSVEKHLVERFTLSADGQSLTYQFELTDPVFLAAPRTASVQWVYTPNAAFDAPPCSVENAKRFIKK